MAWITIVTMMPITFRSDQHSKTMFVSLPILNASQDNLLQPRHQAPVNDLGQRRSPAVRLVLPPLCLGFAATHSMICMEFSGPEQHVLLMFNTMFSSLSHNFDKHGLVMTKKTTSEITSCQMFQTWCGSGLPPPRRGSAPRYRMRLSQVLRLYDKPKLLDIALQLAVWGMIMQLYIV